MKESIAEQITWSRFIRLIRRSIVPELGSTALLLVGLLFLMLLGINGLNVLNSYVGRNFMTAIEGRNLTEFFNQGGFYIGVFAMSAIVAVLSRFTEERLGLLWRERLTKRLVGAYLGDRTYHTLKVNKRVENPDERITDDVRAFTTTTLSFSLMILNSTLTVIAFSSVMLSISETLFLVAVLYAVSGTLFSIFLGRPLVRLNSVQLDKEANFRADLIHVREHAEAIALSRREGRLLQRLRGRVDDLVGNLGSIIRVNRNLGFFSTGYSYLIQIIPALVVAPLFIRGEVEFGVITQSSMAFAHLVAAFSLIITQFQSIASFASVVSRLDTLWEAIERQDPTRSGAIELNVTENPEHIAYEGVTLDAPDEEKALVKNLSLRIAQGTRVLIRSRDKAAGSALFRATAGISSLGHGRIVRPSFDFIRFLPERPYVYPGTLRELLLKTGEEHRIPDPEIVEMLRELDLLPVLTKAGGLDVEQDWSSVLSLSEEQLLAFTRLRLAQPKFAFLDRVCTALTLEQVGRIQKTLTDLRITFIALGEADDDLRYFDAVLDIDRNGDWTYRSLKNDAGLSGA
ncbi:ABC transporter domain protein [Thiocapsa sp. KS1]|nr:SbmA/BacA-like family transporter [Thiocapsa sp. KS1]CRI63242.1 ABC transporter domain protein [Thiocapsa sp. KS1]